MRDVVEKTDCSSLKALKMEKSQPKKGNTPGTLETVIFDGFDLSLTKAPSAGVMHR
jgi:hypothetical protein